MAVTFSRTRTPALLHVGQRQSRKAVFASCAIPRGAVLLVLRGVITRHPSELSLQVSQDRHLHQGGAIIETINHACTANAAVRWNDFTLRSLSRINPGQEVTINYCATEANLAHPFYCECESQNCYHYVAGYRHLSRSQKTAIADTASRHLLATRGVGGWRHEFRYVNPSLPP